MATVGYENDYVAILRAARVLKPNVRAMVGVWSLATSKMAADFPDLMPKVYGTAVLPFAVEFTTADGKAFGETDRKLHNPGSGAGGDDRRQSRWPVWIGAPIPAPSGRSARRTMSI